MVETGNVFVFPHAQCNQYSSARTFKVLEAEEGETVTLTCEISKPGLAVLWKKGTVLLKPGNKYEMKQDGCVLQLQIRDLKSEDSGSYKCCTGSNGDNCFSYGKG